MRSKFVIIILITIAAGYLLSKTSHKVYFPGSVTIELNSGQRDYCQLFLNVYEGYFHTQAYNQPYKDEHGFNRISFKLPAAKIRSLRIDPGAHSEKYTIKQIKISIGKHTEIYSGKQILQNFSLINLELAAPGANDVVTFKPINNHDGQLKLNFRLNDRFDVVSHTELSFIQDIIFFFYLVIVAIILLWGRLVLIQVAGVLRSLYVVNFKGISFTPTKFSLWIAGIFLLKIFLQSAQQMTALTGTVHDDALFIKLAYLLGSGHWLGTYDSYTLIKGPVFPFFIALSNFAGIPLFLAQNILYGFACLLIVKALSPIIQKRNSRIIFFALLMFNPVSSGSFTTHILRDALFVSLSLMVVGAFAGIYMRRSANFNTLFKWGFFAGVVLFLHQNTREEGFVFIPALIFLSAISLFARNSRLRNNISSSFSKKLRIFALFVLPYFMLIAGNIILASVNYGVYGRFLRNEIKSDAFTDAFAALSKIDSETWIVDVPVTYEARKKAYRVSPAFAELEKYMESNGNGFLYCSDYPHEILGAHFIWALRYAADAAGYHQSLPQSQNFYRRIAREINAAFDSGKLKKKNNVSFASYSWDNRFTAPVLKKIRETCNFMFSFKGYSPVSMVSQGSKSDIAYFQNITNETSLIKENTTTTVPLASKLKLRGLMVISKVYGFINPVFWFFAVFSFIVLTVLIILRKGIGKLTEFWVLSFVFFTLTLLRIVLIAFLSVSQWNAMNMQYLSVAYPFMIIFEYLTVIAIFPVLLTVLRSDSKTVIGK